MEEEPENKSAKIFGSLQRKKKQKKGLVLINYEAEMFTVCIGFVH